MFKKTILILTLSTSLFSASILERFSELDSEFEDIVHQTDICVIQMNKLNKSAKYIDTCKPVLKLKRKNIDRLKSKFNTQLERYKERKHKLSQEERTLVKEQVLSIKAKVLNLQKNVHIIFDK